jgi:hypothetical protein
MKLTKRSEQPPRFATWMLKHFGCSPSNDAILGDLVEQYQQGQSALWYCKQVFSTIVVSFFRDVWEHKRLAFLSILAGIACLQLWSFFGSLPPRPTIVIPGIVEFQVPRLGMRMPDVISFVVIGWVLARLAPDRRKTAVFAFSGFILLSGIIGYLGWSLGMMDYHPMGSPGEQVLNFVIRNAVNSAGLFAGYAVIGWVLARLGRDHSEMAVFAFSGFLLLYGMISYLVAYNAVGNLVGALGFVIASVVNTAGLFFGGGILTNPRQ